jgi:PHD/YefM family antitoxin component YafN of YafNO toxin-antitoxin module
LRRICDGGALSNAAKRVSIRAGNGKRERGERTIAVSDESPSADGPAGGLKRVSSAEMAKRFSAYCDLALNAPIIVTKNGRDRLVVLSIDEFNFLRDLVERSGATVARDETKSPRSRFAAKKAAS